MAYSVRTIKRFDKSVERMKKRGLPMEDLHGVISLLMQTGTLPAHYRPHKLPGNYKGKWKCHKVTGCLFGSNMKQNCYL